MAGLLATVKALLRGRDYDIELLLARSRTLFRTLFYKQLPLLLSE